jgi:TRAP-type C4-dicarboxylate transport system substrate-binding protein
MSSQITRRNLLGTAAAAAASIAASAVLRAQTLTFKLHHFLGPTSPSQTQMLEPWARRVEELAGGAVRIEIYPSMTLGGRPQELINQARDGVVDLVWTVNGYTPGLFPRTEVMELPFVYVNDPTATNLAMADLFDDYLREEYAGVEVMFLHVHAGQALHTRDRLVRRPEEWEGLRIRIPTRTGAWVIEALKASPVAMPVPELPQALAKGVVDAALIPFEIIPPLRLQEQTHYQIEGHRSTRFGNTTFQVSMNAARWASLPAEIQQAFRAASGREWLAELGRIWRSTDDAGIRFAVEAGNEHVVLSEEETEAYRAWLEPVVARWIDDVSGKGIDGATLVAKARERIQANSAS